MSVQVIDSIFDKEYIVEMRKALDNVPHRPTNIANRITWPYGNVGTHKILGSTLYKKKSKYVHVTTGPEIFMEAFEHIANTVLKKEFELQAIRTNMQVLAMDSSFHSDGDAKTLLLFATDEWHKDWGGEFEIIVDEETSKTEKIDYVPGRVIYFDGNIRHRGLAPLVPNVYRYSVAYRCLEINAV